ncbi:MAG: TatD family hydrolase [Clostridia bacterium]|nr:TatD family hydrolase [Clostridia bacterium]
MAMQYFDSHAHYNDAAFDADREEILARLPDAGVVGVVNVGCSAASSEDAVRLTQRWPYFYAAVGIHPEDAAQAAEGDLDRIASLTSNEKVVAIGEIGLDYHFEACPRETQLRIFEAQLALANRLGLPVIIHDREAHGDTMELLRRYRPRGVMHCFSGSPEMAAQLVRLGLYIGFTGVVTFKNARNATETAAALPFDRILIETDCPYMAPEPFRGRRCDSTMLPRTLERIALLRGIEPEAAAEQFIANTAFCFGIKTPLPGASGSN